MEVDEFVGGDAVLTDLVERLDELGPHHHGLFKASFSFEPDHSEADQTLKPRVVVDQSFGVGKAHPLGLLGGPAARDRRFQPEHVADVLALLPGGQHLVHVGDVVATVEQGGDQPQPRQVRVVEQGDPAHAQRRMQQAPVTVDADVAGGGARQSCQLLDAVLAGRRDAVWLDGRVEQLRHRRLDHIA